MAYLQAKERGDDPEPMTIPLERGMLRSGERANRGSQRRAALRTRRSIAASRAAELHGLGADDASNGPTGEKPLQHIEADVPARSAHRYESTVDGCPVPPS